MGVMPTTGGSSTEGASTEGASTEGASTKRSSSGQRRGKVRATGPRASSYTLVRGAHRLVPAPVLDPSQQRVVDHGAGPLLVLAGPGTGKTTTIVEAVVSRIDRGLDPEQVLVLTFARKAAAELRERITARLARATKEPLARTFHSYAFGVLRREAALRGEPTPRLLSGPEQDLVIRDLLAGDVGAGAGSWPARLHPALGTRGFAQELRDLIMRAYERGLTPSDLNRLGREHGRDDWQAAARFMRQYGEVTALREAAAYDPAELIRAVVSLWISDPALLAREREARQVVFVDELQDTDPAQIELLRLLAGGGRDLVAVGDPDQSIYGFRGADVSGIERFPETFRTAGGAPTPVLALNTSRRSGPVLLAATRRVASRLAAAGDHRSLQPGEDLPPGEMSVALLRSESQEAAYVAARLREAHLVDGVPWSQMAVLVRSTVRSLPVLRRAFGAAGVPVAVAAEEVPLAVQPAVRPLLTVLGCVVDPDSLGEDQAVELLTSALGGADVIGLRRLRQELRRAELDAGGRRTSGPLLVEAITDPHALVDVEPGAARPAARVARLLQAASETQASAGASVEDVLWAVWEASGLSGRWERASLEGGPAGAAADRDLDAVVALFETAARFCDRLPGAGSEVFLAHLTGQEIPADSLAARAPSGDAVAVLTAHASKGLEWDLVCVTGVQEGVWPSSRLRGSFLGTERLVDLLRPGAESLPADVAAVTTLSRLLAEERRLFYVAVTRARRRLLVTAVTSEREGLSPSRFIDEIDPLPTGVGEDANRAVTVVTRPLSLAGLVAELRRTVSAGGETGDDRRQGAAAQLARLAAAGARGADPRTWWGLAPLSDDRNVRDDGEDVRVSPSKVEMFTRCELRWFLEHVGGTETTTSAQNVGTLVHAVAESALDDASSTEQALLAKLDALLPTVELGRGWAAEKELAKARGMVAKLARWLADNRHEVVATELDFTVSVGRAELGGRVDRLERDDLGRAVVIDLKTGSRSVAKDDVLEHAQLAAYQLAAEEGAFADLGLHASGGAALLQVGKGGLTHDAREQRQESLSDYPDPDWARRLVTEAAEGMAGSAFRAVDNDLCTRCPVRTSCPVQDDGRMVTS
jgi:superfamily I DNA/RNA helicase/RecB family exonuclease